MKRCGVIWFVMSTLAVAGCGEAPGPSADLPLEAPSPPAPDDVPHWCGGDANPGVIETYFQQLESHLAKSEQAVPMAFYGERFSVTSGGRYLVFRRAEMGPGARALPSRDDWREISRRGAKGLDSVGWRGCMFAHGKVWFESDGGSFTLIAFNKDMPWDAPP